MEDNFSVSWTIFFSSSLPFFTAYSTFCSTDYSFYSSNADEKLEVINEEGLQKKTCLTVDQNLSQSKPTL